MTSNNIATNPEYKKRNTQIIIKTDSFNIQDYSFERL